MKRLLSVFALLSSIACAAGCSSASSSSFNSDAGPAITGTGTATASGTVPGLALDSPTARSIARSEPPFTQLMIAPTELTCSVIDTSDHITIDLGAQTTGTYVVVKGFPTKPGLSGFQARAHACPAAATNAAPCHDQILKGQVVVMKYDAAPGGKVEGTYELTFADGTITGSFSALRCN